METIRNTTACPCRACARLAGVPTLRAAEEARLAPAPRAPAALDERLGRCGATAPVLVESNASWRGGER